MLACLPAIHRCEGNPEQCGQPFLREPAGCAQNADGWSVEVLSSKDRHCHPGTDDPRKE